MKKLISFLFVLGFVVSGFCQVAQQTQSAPAKAAPVKKATKSPAVKLLKMKGAVVSTDAVKGEIVVSVVVGKEKKNVDKTVTTNEKTSITKAGKSITLADIAIGEKVSVVYSVAADKIIAKSISVIVPSKQAAPVKKETAPAAAPEKK